MITNDDVYKIREQDAENAIYVHEYYLFKREKQNISRKTVNEMQIHKRARAQTRPTRQRIVNSRIFNTRKNEINSYRVLLLVIIFYTVTRVRV